MKNPYSQMLLREPLKIKDLDIFLNGTQVINKNLKVLIKGVFRLITAKTQTNKLHLTLLITSILFYKNRLLIKSQSVRYAEDVVSQRY